MERAEQELEKERVIPPHSNGKKVVVIILKDADGWFLVHQRRLDRGPDRGKYGLGAGGWFDFDEMGEDRGEAAKQNFEEAAKRKLEEETGITTSPKYIFDFDFPKESTTRRVYVFDAIVDRDHVRNRKEWIEMDWLTIEGVDAVRDTLCPDTIVVWERYKTYLRPRNLPVLLEKMITDFLITDHSKQTQEAVFQEASNEVIAYPELSAVEVSAKISKREQEQLMEAVIHFNTEMNNLLESDRQLLEMKAKGYSYEQIMHQLNIEDGATIRRRLRQIGEKWKRSFHS